MQIDFLLFLFLFYTVSALPLRDRPPPTLSTAPNALGTVTDILGVNASAPNSQFLAKRAPPTESDVQYVVTVCSEMRWQGETCHLLGEGTYGKTFSVKTRDGRARILKDIKHMGTRSQMHDIEREVRNLQAVDQLIGWGCSGGNTRCFILMRDMGMSQQEILVTSQKTSDHRTQALFSNKEDVEAMQDKAIMRYIRYYDIIHRDFHDGNFVYRQLTQDDPTTWRAELIDWSLAVPIHSYHDEPRKMETIVV